MPEMVIELGVSPLPSPFSSTVATVHSGQPTTPSVGARSINSRDLHIKITVTDRTNIRNDRNRRTPDQPPDDGRHPRRRRPEEVCPSR
jgi:hypothetical protein